MKKNILRIMVAAALLGWLSLLVFFWAFNAFVFLQHPDQNWGELGFVPTTILESFFISLGYVLSFLMVFLPWTYIKYRKHLSNMRLREAGFGGIAFGIMVTVFSTIALECFMGGSFSDFMAELAGICSVEGLCWPISAMISGAVTFGFAAWAKECELNPA